MATEIDAQDAATTKRRPRKKKETAKPAPVIEAPPPAHPRLVGIGASAGGLEALSTLISALPVDLGIAYVVVQHLSPTHRSMLVQLLGRETAMAVREVEDNLVPEANVIYVAPASRNVVLREGRFALLETVREALPKPSVNAFFSSLASSVGEDAIGVVLSGTGSDGAVGLREIKAAGGFTFAQEPKSAKYSGMPQSAIDAGCVDWTLPPERIAGEIAAIIRNHGVSRLPANNSQPPATTIKKLLMRVKQQTRIDFGGYKEATLWRRIERRMAANHIVRVEDYLSLTENQPEELDRLAKDILISVTAFFRDPDAFDQLNLALVPILRTKQPGDEIRIWVAGCATGEEAYSIAILLAEALGPQALQYKIQIFATDLDNEAMAIARKGIYAEGSLTELKPNLIARYFQPQRSRYEISRTLRDMVVFARQDLVQDPPFLRLDLISCRNVLIYLKSDLQAKILSTFHYGLRPGGILFLGKSEGVFQQEGLFEVVDKSARIFRRSTVEGRIPLINFQLPTLGDTPSSTPRPVDAEQRLLEAAVRNYVPASVLINGNFDIQHIYGDVSAYVTIPAGKPSLNLQHLIRRELRTDLQLLQHQAEQKLESAQGRPRALGASASEGQLRLAVHPLEPGVSNQFYIVSFEAMKEEQRPVSTEGETDSESARNARDLEDELITTRERLQTVIEELETSNEEMQALNEEVQAANEELQSSNEELEAANEELQSTNEELTTVNEELQVRTSELAETLNDLEQVQNSVGYPILVCNEQLRLVRFNGPAAALFSLAPSSLNQPLSTLRLLPGMQDFSAKVAVALNSKIVIDEPIFSAERHYLLHITPYDTATGNNRGVIITLLDDTDRLTRERELRDNQKKLMSIMNNSTSIITLKDLAGRYQFVNRQFEQVFALPFSEVVGKTDAQLFSARVADLFRSKELEVVRRQRAQEHEDCLPFAEGDRYLLSIRFPLMDEEGVISGICTQSTDITARKRAEDQLRLAARVFDRAGEGIVVTDAQQVILTVNEAFSNVTGYQADEVVGHTPHLLASGRHPGEFYLDMWEKLTSQGWWQGEIWNRRKNGEIYPEWLTINAVHDSEGTVVNYVGIFSDITVVKESQRRIEFLATHDELTNLPNRALFLDRMRQMVARAERQNLGFAVLFVDLDNFKVINDSLGHAAGDAMLVEVAERLKQCVRAMDTVARFGGDEFALLLENATESDAEITANRIFEALLPPIRVDNQQLHASASIGICLYPEDGKEPDVLLKNADSAMYQAKDGGKRRHHFFTNELRQAADERLRIEHGLRQALERNELFLMYQPQVEIATGTVIGVEALVRWRHPENGLIAPDRFIPIAEKTGLIIQVGEFVFDAACRQMALWQTEGQKIGHISINLSAEELRRADVPERLRRLLAHYHLTPDQIRLELTETALMADAGLSQSVLHDIKQLGVPLAVDDFGTGYSSLAYLRRFPLSELKIDRSFVDDIATHDDDRTIAATIVAMANTLGLTVVAEGIETAEQCEVLRQIGCPLGQGYLFARPLSADEVTRHFPR